MIEGLISRDTFDGPVGIRRELVPPVGAWIVPATLSSMDDAISDCLGWWGGAASTLIPVDHDGMASLWRSHLKACSPDFVISKSADSADSHDHFQFPISLAAVLAARPDGKKAYADVVVPELATDDPWRAGFLSVFGSWPDSPGPRQLQMTNLIPEVRYSDIVSVKREAFDGSAETFFQLLLKGRTNYPTPISLVHLGSLSSTFYWNGPEQLKPAGARWRAPRRAVVVLYDPSAPASDIALTWNLRSAHGWSPGLPLAIPIDHARAAADILRQHSRELIGLTHDSLAVTSTTLGQDVLERHARLFPKGSATPAERLLTVPHRPGRLGAEVCHFDAGVGSFRALADEDRDLLRRMPLAGYPSMMVRARPLHVALPESKSLTLSNAFLNHRYRGGGFETNLSDRQPLTSLAWPSSWMVLQAAARDRDLTVRESQAGLAASRLTRLLGSIEAIDNLRSPALMTLLEELGQARGMTWFKHRLGGTQTGDVPRFPSTKNVVPLPDADVHDLTYTRLRQVIQDRRGAKEWLSWADATGLLARGIVVNCNHCGAVPWLRMADCAPPVRCRACNGEMANPFPPDSIHFRYRACHQLLGAIEFDVLPHLFSMWWMWSLFRPLFDEPNALYGIHPGVEFIDDSNRVVGEADIVLLFRDGGVAIGECKRSFSGFAPAELDKLDSLAERLDAHWTFTAVTSLRSQLDAEWEERSPSGRNRFLLTAEHLFESFPVWGMSEEPTSQRTDDAALTRRDDEMGQALLMRHHRPGSEPDEDIRLAWADEERLHEQP